MSDNEDNKVDLQEGGERQSAASNTGKKNKKKNKNGKGKGKQAEETTTTAADTTAATT